MTFENLKLVVKQCYQLGQFYWTKIGGKFQNWKMSNATFWMIFKHCEKYKKCTFAFLQFLGPA